MDRERLHLPVHVDNAEGVSMLYGGASWASIQRHRFTAQAQRQDERDNGSFFFKTPHHQVQAGHSGVQHRAEGPIVPRLVCLHDWDSIIYLFHPG